MVAVIVIFIAVFIVIVIVIVIVFANDAFWFGFGQHNNVVLIEGNCVL
jgi:hypothetical protein